MASAGNDHRLGANEAPPAIISMFLGDELTAVLHAIEDGTRQYSGVQAKSWRPAFMLPDLNRDNTDRNRTSRLRLYGK